MIRMKGAGIYATLILLGLAICNLQAQTYDSIVCDTGSMTIRFDCVPTINGHELQNGDVISLLSATDAMDEEGSLAYNSDSANVIILYVSTNDFASPESNQLKFSVHSQEFGCSSTNIKLRTDSANISDCLLSVISFNASFHSLEYPAGIVCLTDEPFLPVTDLPDDSFTLFTEDSGLALGESGEVQPQNSVPGIYTLQIQTTYCLEQDSVQLEIMAPPFLDLSDTLQVCRGTSIGTFNQSYPGVNVYADNDLTSVYLSTISASGEYIVNSYDTPCPAVDTVFIEVLELPEFFIDITEECDRVILGTIPVNESMINTSTSYADAEGLVRSNEVYEDGEVFLTVTDQNGCTAKDSVYVQVKRMELVAADFIKEEADCWDNGELIIEDQTLNNNVGMFHYRLKNTLTDQLVTELDNVPEGLYKLQVFDERDCMAELEEPITIIQKCLEDYPVFTPDGDNIEDSYFIPHTGSVTIYNREGVPVRELETPAYWDGRDGAGNILPMGNYLMITDTDRKVNITIVR